jgi:hypothetical protein
MSSTTSWFAIQRFTSMKKSIASMEQSKKLVSRNQSSRLLSAGGQTSSHYFDPGKK